MHIRFDRTLLFGVSMTGSLLLLLSSPMLLSSIGNLQRMVDYQEAKKAAKFEAEKQEEEEASRARAASNDVEQQEKKV